MTRIQLTGNMSVEGPGGTLTEDNLEGRQGRILLAFLLADPHRSVTFDEMAEVLWPKQDSLPKNWRKNTSAVVSKLRSALREIDLSGLIPDGRTGRLRAALPTDAWIDLEAAREAVVMAEDCLGRHDPLGAAYHAAIARAVTERPLLPGEEGPWIEAKRDELRLLRQKALDQLFDAHLQLGQPLGAVTAAEAMLSLDRFTERPYQKLMTAHVAAGDPAQALRVYERCRNLLRDELGIQPSPETERLYLEILRRDDPGRRAPHQLRDATMPDPIGWATVPERPLLTRHELLNVATELLRASSTYRATSVGPLFLHPPWVVERRNARRQSSNYETAVRNFVEMLSRDRRTHNVRFIFRNSPRYRAKVDEFVDIHERRPFIRDVLEAIDEVWGGGAYGPDICCADTGYLAVAMIFDDGAISSFRRGPMSPIEGGQLWTSPPLIERERARFDAVFDATSEGQDAELAKLRDFIESLW